MNTSRYLASFAILIAGACTTAMNWQFSYQLGTTPLSCYTWAIFSVALDVSKWLMLPCASLAWAANHKLRTLAAVMIWLVATLYSFTAAVGFAAMNKDISTAERRLQVELQKILTTMKQSPRWQSSAACADATSPQSIQFCATYRDAEARLKFTSPDPDPQSTLLATLTGFDIEKVRTALAFFLAIACEVISALGFYAVLPTGRANGPHTPTPPAPRWKPPAWNEIAGRAAARSVWTRPDASRRGAT